MGCEQPAHTVRVSGFQHRIEPEGLTANSGAVDTYNTTGDIKPSSQAKPSRGYDGDKITSSLSSQTPSRGILQSWLFFRTPEGDIYHHQIQHCNCNYRTTAAQNSKCHFQLQLPTSNCNSIPEPSSTYLYGNISSRSHPFAQLNLAIVTPSVTVAL